MAERTKTRDITIVEKGGSFGTFFKKFSSQKEEYDFEGLSTLRKLLSNEKARLIHIVKTKNPNSIYELAKMLNREIKSVKKDIKLLERFGIIDRVSEKKNGRERHKPVVAIDSLYINLKL